MKILFCLVRGIVIGFKSIMLFYICDIITMICSNIPYFFSAFLFGLLNGFLDGIIVSIKNKTIHKIFSSIIGFFATIFIFLLSLKINLPNVLADRYIYGEGGGGLEPGGWLGFSFYALIFFGTSVFISFPSTIIIISEKKKIQKISILR